VLTCIIRCHIDPAKKAEFEQYARNWGAGDPSVRRGPRRLIRTARRLDHARLWHLLDREPRCLRAVQSPAGRRSDGARELRIRQAGAFSAARGPHVPHAGLGAAQPDGEAMSAAIFEVEPASGRRDNELVTADALKPTLKAIDGFIRFSRKRGALLFAQNQREAPPHLMRRSAGAGEELPLTREAMAFVGAVRVTALQATFQCGAGPCVDGSGLSSADCSIAAVVEAAMCPAFERGSDGRWP